MIQATVRRPGMARELNWAQQQMPARLTSLSFALAPDNGLLQRRLVMPMNEICDDRQRVLGTIDLR